MDIRRSLWKNVSSFFRKSSISFVIALNLCIVVLCFSSVWENYSLFQIYCFLTKIERLVVNWLNVVQFQEPNWIKLIFFLKYLNKNILSSFLINLIYKCHTFKVFNLCTLRILFYCFGWSSFIFLQIMRIACIFWLDVFLKFVIYVLLQAMLT